MAPRHRRHEPERREVGLRCMQPRACTQRRVRKRDAEHRRVTTRDRPVGRRPRDDQQSAQCAPVPATLALHDLGDDSDLLRHRHQHRLQVGQLGLDLDDEQRSIGRVPAKDVHGSTVSEAVERELGFDDPAGRGEAGSHDLHDRGVSSIKQAVGQPTPPSSVDDQVHAERGGDPPARSERHALQSSVLEIRDDRLIDVRDPSHIRLPKPMVMSNGADDPADAQVVHRGIVAGGASPPLHCERSERE